MFTISGNFNRCEHMLGDPRCSDDLIPGSPDQQDWTLISERGKQNGLDMLQSNFVNMRINDLKYKYEVFI